MDHFARQVAVFSYVPHDNQRKLKSTHLIYLQKGKRFLRLVKTLSKKVSEYKRRKVPGLCLCIVIQQWYKFNTRPTIICLLAENENKEI